MMEGFSLLVNLYRGHLSVKKNKYIRGERGLTFVMGKPSSGKTEYCLMRAKECLLQSKSVLYIASDPPGDFRLDELVVLGRKGPPSRRLSLVNLHYGPLRYFFKNSDITNFDLIIVDEEWTVASDWIDHPPDWIDHCILPHQEIIIAQHKYPILGLK